MALEVRPAMSSDSEFIFRVKRAAFREYVELVFGWREAEQRQLHDKRFDGQSCRILVREGADVGYMATSLGEDCFHLHQLFLLPEYQGKGIGAEAMRIVMAEADERRLPIRLQVLKVNPRAQRFYERLGSRLTGETETHFQMEIPYQEGSSEQY